MSATVKPEADVRISSRNVAVLGSESPLRGKRERERERDGWRERREKVREGERERGNILHSAGGLYSGAVLGLTHKLTGMPNLFAKGLRHWHQMLL